MPNVLSAWATTNIDSFSTTPQIPVPLHSLLQNDIDWSFYQPQPKAIDNLMILHINQLLLHFYNPLLSIKIWTNSRKHGLGGVFEQKSKRCWQLTAYASRATTPAEQNYCPLEREALSDLFGCKKSTNLYMNTILKLKKNDH